MSDETIDEIEDSSAPLIEHLTELRTRLIRAFMAFVVAMCFCFFFAAPILDFLLDPIRRILISHGQDATLIFTSPQEKFFVYFRISILGGIMLAFPMIANELWRFVAPGLYKNEKGAFLPFIIASPALFLLGASFAHYVVTPLAMNFFIGFGDIIPVLTNLGEANPEPISGEDAELKTVFLGSLRESLDLTMKFIWAFGICFQLPVLMTLLGMAGLVSADGLKDMRKYAVVGILTLAAIITPPDVVTQVILFTVVYMLYEVSIQLVAAVERKREARLREDGYYDDEDGHPEDNA